MPLIHCAPDKTQLPREAVSRGAPGAAFRPSRAVGTLSTAGDGSSTLNCMKTVSREERNILIMAKRSGKSKVCSFKYGPAGNQYHESKRYYHGCKHYVE